MLQMWAIKSSNTQLSTTSFFRVGGSGDGDDPCGATKSSNKLFHPIFVNILCNKTPQKALIDTGSAITIIHQQLLNKIPHREFVKTKKNHVSASCSNINVVGETLLDISIDGITTQIMADVAGDLVTDLILGTDWIEPNNVYIMTPERRIMIKQRNKVASTPFVEPPDLNYPVTLINHITIPPFSEQIIEVQCTHNNMTNALFEPTPKLQNKALFVANTLSHISNNRMKIQIINATERQQTLSEKTKMGTVTSMLTTINFISEQPTSAKRSPQGKACMTLISQGKSVTEQHQCRECKQRFTTRNELFKHLKNECYPDDIRHQITKLTEHIVDKKQREQITNMLWKYGALFDTSKPSKIEQRSRNIERGDTKVDEQGNHRTFDISVVFSCGVSEKEGRYNQILR